MASPISAFSAFPAIRHDSLTLVALPNAVWLARAYTAATLRGWGFSDEQFVDDARLLVSELVTNAVQALGMHVVMPKVSTLLADESLIRLVLEVVPGVDALLIEVWDADPRAPARPGRPGIDSEHGRGLAIVDGLAASWGYRYPKDAALPWIKVVYATIRSPPTGGANRRCP
ncbi:ATP-binding protein [Spongiactinospora sp. TRM90649]|uniref:ATP-binding protein n=1 Tax=Spongiactinospora sp. TRM90649 TaxID=3031114 RepID=UPI0023F6F942|nr:ATP-binding protein [Spongiactinospora sp. TRM90649]MDF5751449.1 ATP-binding protein [Spongiactinospora sp. TRM90649]